MAFNEANNTFLFGRLESDFKTDNFNFLDKICPQKVIFSQKQKGEHRY